MRAYRTLAVVVLGACFASASPLRAEDFFPFSVWYSGGKARAPMLEPVDETSRERWRTDLERIKRLGFNTVRTWVEWTANEPREGEYDFSNLELLAELAGEVGLKLFLQVYVDSAPDWVGDRWADARFVAQSGAVVPSQSAPGFCFDHGEVREKILDYYRRVARVASRYPNFIGWDLWSEPHIINWAIIDYVPNATFCYCPSSIRRFRDWLRGKYGSLESLNRAWYRTFTDWEQVEPPRFGTILSYTDFIDWRVFVREKLAEDLRLRHEAVKSVDPTRVTTSHAAVPGLFTSPLMGVGSPDDWLMAEAADYWGTSIYPKHSFPERHWSLLTLTSLMDFARSSGRHKPGFYVGELQAGLGIRGTVVGDPVTAEDQRLWVLGMLSRGARAINVYAYYPMSSGYEAGGYGLIELDGRVTPRAEALGGLAAMVDRNRELILAASPPASEVAVVYNPLAYLVGGEQHLSPAGAVRESLQGIYRAFWRRNIPVDFIHLREVEAERLEGYKVLFLPYPLMLTEASADGLKRFVRNGGTLVTEARCGWNDDRGFSQDVIPGFGLDEVFGVREGRLKMEDSVEILLTDLGARFVSRPAGTVARGVGIRGDFQTYPGTEVLAEFRDGAPAMTSRSFGAGRAIVAGTFLGMANGRRPDEATEEVFAAAARSAGVSPLFGLELPLSERPVEVRVLESPERKIVFLFNHGDDPASVELPFGKLVDLETGEEIEGGELILAGAQIRVLVTPAEGP